MEVYLVENAPWNIGSERQEFIGVGAHLFAIACKRSFEAGCEDGIGGLLRSCASRRGDGSESAIHCDAKGEATGGYLLRRRRDMTSETSDCSRERANWRSSPEACWKCLYRMGSARKSSKRHVGRLNS